MTEWVESICIVLISALFFVFLGAFIDAEIKNKELKAQLADPAHCVSVCVEEFEKHGC